MENSLLTILLKHYYPQTSEKVDQLLASNKLFKNLITKVYSKLEENVQNYADVSVRLIELTKMLEAWRKEEYSDISYVNVSIATFILIYYVSPYDVIPDFIPFVGRLDDEWILKNGLNILDVELQKFEHWKTAQ
jgi:uncharacterized membrane protein YkvA (DUF1232 family)